MPHRVMDHARTRNTNINHRLRLAHTMKSAGHKGVVFHRIRKTDEFGARQPTLITGALGSFFDDSSDMAHNIHVDTGARRGWVDGRAQGFGRGDRWGNEVQKPHL